VVDQPLKAEPEQREQPAARLGSSASRWKRQSRAPCCMQKIDGVVVQTSVSCEYQRKLP
jgi:hypothetical protein